VNNGHSLSRTLASKAAVIFDLFYTLTCIELTSAGKRVRNCDVLGVPSDAWDAQLLLQSPDRLFGTIRDPYAIVADLARAIDPSISHERICQTVAHRQSVFEAALMDMPASSASFFDVEALSSPVKRHR
jgi:hypothetical protein